MSIQSSPMSVLKTHVLSPARPAKIHILSIPYSSYHLLNTWYNVIFKQKMAIFTPHYGFQNITRK
jgi:hypothetical protein